jgi:hypothetical protein
MAEHIIGLTLGAEDDWPTAFEALLRRALLNFVEDGQRHTFALERVTFEPFDLRSKPRHRLVIDRAAWWYPLPREWLKKVAVMDDVYLLNNPFTFQAMEKHTAYCAMMRLGLNIPETWLLPHKVGPSNERYPATSERYNKLFDLDGIADRIGYPQYMKPFDGGGWRGVSRIDNRGDLHRAYDGSGQSLMHIQKGIADFDHFARSLTIGPQTRIMRYRPERPMHERYEETIDFLDAKLADEITMVSRVINAYFRWEFNSCETIVKDGKAWPIDYANACPDVAITSLHVHFPWAMKSLLKWAIFCAATKRKMALDLDQRKYFEIADRNDLSIASKLKAYFDLSERYFDSDRFEEFCRKHLSHIDEVAHEYFSSKEFDDLLVRTVRDSFQPHERDHFVGHYRGLMTGWARRSEHAGSVIPANAGFQ